MQTDITNMKTDITNMKTDITNMKTDITNMKNTLQTLQGFQNNESKAIEFELKMVLKKYLKNKFPSFTLKSLEMKKPRDPYTNETITDLDAAFILENINMRQNFTRLKERGMTISPHLFNKNEISDKRIFILAEAKHYIDLAKIKEKLSQFDRICNIFKLANRLDNSEDIEVESKKLKVHKDFISTVKHNKYLSKINEYYLFFGATYWETNIMEKLETDINKRAKLVCAFLEPNNTNNINKVEIYKKICEIDAKWYTPENMPNNPVISDTTIITLTEIKGGLGYTKLIEPSGERYNVVSNNTFLNFEGMSTFGGNITRKKNRRYSTT
jgi:hypothetical protein